MAVSCATARKPPNCQRLKPDYANVPKVSGTLLGHSLPDCTVILCPLRAWFNPRELPGPSSSCLLALFVSQLAAVAVGVAKLWPSGMAIEALLLPSPGIGPPLETQIRPPEAVERAGNG